MSPGVRGVSLDAEAAYNGRMKRPVDRVPLDRVNDLLDPRLNQLHNVDVDEARRRVLSGDPAAVRAIDGSFALVTVDGITVRMARSLDRPMRYFLAKRHGRAGAVRGGPHRHAARALEEAGLENQFHPSYTRMVPAHYIVELALVGCPDPDPTYTRFFTPGRGTLPPDLDEIGRRYIGALADEIAKWLIGIDRRGGGAEPIGVSFSGGIDSGSVFLVTYHTMLRLGMAPARLKAFVLDLGNGPDVAQARAFLGAVGLSMFLEEIDGTRGRSRRRADAARARRLQVARRRVRRDGSAALQGHPRALPRLAPSRRRRRRRREPEGLPDRRESRAHHPQRRGQRDAVPGGLGRRPHQALAHVQRRPQPELRADVRARAAVRVRRLQSLHPARTSSRSPKGFRSRR